MIIKLKNLSEAREALLNLNENSLSSQSKWTSYEIFVHCSKTIEYSMTGYPAMKPAIVRYTIGKLAIKKFLSQGEMKHDLHADVSGSPMIEKKGSFEEGRQILLDSIDKFTAYKGEMKPHLLFGKVSQANYEQYFAMHIADHLSLFQ